MSHPLDFDDGIVRCDTCGANIPEDEARGLVRLVYKENVDYEGQAEHSRHRLRVCSRCHGRSLRRQRLRELREWAVMLVVLAFAIGVAIVIAVSLLRGAGGR